MSDRIWLQMNFYPGWMQNQPLFPAANDFIFSSTVFINYMAKIIIKQTAMIKGRYFCNIMTLPLLRRRRKKATDFVTWNTICSSWWEFEQKRVPDKCACQGSLVNRSILIDFWGLYYHSYSMVCSYCATLQNNLNR